MAILQGSGINRTTLFNYAAGFLVVGFFTICALIPGLLDNYLLQVGFRLMLFIVLAEAWNLLAGYGGLVSLGSASFIGLGAYVFVGLLNSLGLPIPVAIAIAGLSGSAFAVLVSPAVFRMRGLFFTVGTLALGEALRLFVVNAPWFGGSRGLYLNADFPTPVELYFMALTLLVLAQVVITCLTQSRLSVLIRALRDDEDAAAQIGVHPFRLKVMIFAISGFLMAAGGSLQAFKLGAVEPYGMFGLQWSVDILAMVIIGGLGLRYGAIVGAFFIVIMAEILADYPEIHIIVTGLFLIAIVRFAPKGLCGVVAKFNKAAREKSADRSQREASQ